MSSKNECNEYQLAASFSLLSLITGINHNYMILYSPGASERSELANLALDLATFSHSLTLKATFARLYFERGLIQDGHSWLRL